MKEEKEIVDTSIKMDADTADAFFNMQSGISVKEHFGEILKIWSKVRQDDENGQWLTFTTYIENTFAQVKSQNSQTFSILGRYLYGGIEQGEIECKDEKYPIRVFDVKTNDYIEKNYERKEIRKWCEAVNKEFEIDLKIDEELNSDSDNKPKFKYKFGINMFWDINRKKYLIEETFEIKREGYSERDKKEEDYLKTKRYKYICSKEELKSIFKNKKYLLFAPEHKKEKYCDIIDKSVIPLGQLEKELKEYYYGLKKEEKKEEEKKAVVAKTISVYKKDIEQFKNYVKIMEYRRQNECLQEMLKVWKNVRDAEINNTLLSFTMYVENTFKASKKFRDQKVFSISGCYLCGYIERGEICYEVPNFDDFRYWIVQKDDNIVFSRKYCTKEEMQKWRNAINEEFQVDLDIEKEVKSDIESNLQRFSKFRYESGINMYWDINRKKYLVEDIFTIQKIRHEMHMENLGVRDNPYLKGNVKKENHLMARKYIYITNTKDLEDIFIKDRIRLLFQPENKKDIYFRFLEKSIKPIEDFESLEDELKKYYENEKK